MDDNAFHDGQGNLGNRRGEFEPLKPVEGFSFAKLTLYSLGAATATLLFTTALLVMLAPYSKIWALMVGLLGVVLTVCVMGFVARRATDRMLDENDRDSDAKK